MGGQPIGEPSAGIPIRAGRPASGASKTEDTLTRLFQVHVFLGVCGTALADLPSTKDQPFALACSPATCIDRTLRAFPPVSGASQISVATCPPVLPSCDRTAFSASGPLLMTRRWPRTRSAASAPVVGQKRAAAQESTQGPEPVPLHGQADWLDARLQEEMRQRS
ncbi:hypothetical protein GCM10009527_033130 [Actinomadura nitritigenes]